MPVLDHWLSSTVPYITNYTHHRGLTCALHVASTNLTWCFDRRYSAAVCRRPRVVIASCVVATLVCSMGLFRVNIITNPDLIWVSCCRLHCRKYADLELCVCRDLMLNSSRWHLRLYPHPVTPPRAPTDQDPRAEAVALPLGCAVLRLRPLPAPVCHCHARTNGEVLPVFFCKLFVNCSHGVLVLRYCCVHAGQLVARYVYTTAPFARAYFRCRKVCRPK